MNTGFTSGEGWREAHIHENEMILNPRKLSRVTVVDNGGRVYERYDVVVDLSIQDDGRTLKVFVHERKHLQQPVIEEER